MCLNLFFPSPPKAEVDTTVWLRIQIFSMYIPECSWCQIEADISAFMGVGPQEKKYSAGVNLENLSLDFAFMQLVTIGSGFGMWRLDESNPHADNSKFV
jgi:hypothetical protein